jgi:nondiscriminating aspartyl-tRNA synthetase
MVFIMKHDEKLASSTSMKDRYVSAIGAHDEGRTITIAGWVHSVREMGALTFISLRDGTGRMQVKVPFKMEEKPEREATIQVKGKVKKDSRAPGGLEIEAEELHVLGRVYATPVFYPGQKNGPGLKIRLDNPSMDLRSEKTRAVFNIRACLESGFREVLMGLGFEEITPACIVGSATEGGAQLFKIDYFGTPAFLGQSPQFYKQFAVIGGMERVFMTTPVFRAEKHEGPLHINEILQMDIEMAFATDKDALAILSQVFLHMLNRVKERNAADFKALGMELKVPSEIPVLIYSDLVEMLMANGEKMRFGDDFSKEQEAKICELAKSEAIIIKDYPTAVRAFYSLPYEDNPKISKSYDLIYRGVEICSGAQRIHTPDLLEKQIAARGMDPAYFKTYIDAFRYGAPPHAGWSIGLDRLTMAVCKLENVREAIMFPRDKQRVRP